MKRGMDSSQNYIKKEESMHTALKYRNYYIVAVSLKSSQMHTI